MVRVNIIDPKKLADQHLIAEYDEILMLCGYVKRFPQKKDIPQTYRLGKGHIKFFKDKLLYLKKRHDLLKTEMKIRGFKPTKSISLSEFPRELVNDWNPRKEDKGIIMNRIKEKIALKPEWYRYYGENKPADFFVKMLN